MPGKPNLSVSYSSKSATAKVVIQDKAFAIPFMAGAIVAVSLVLLVILSAKGLI